MEHSYNKQKSHFHLLLGAHPQEFMSRGKPGGPFLFLGGIREKLRGSLQLRVCRICGREETRWRAAVLKGRRSTSPSRSSTTRVLEPHIQKSLRRRRRRRRRRETAFIQLQLGSGIRNALLMLMKLSPSSRVPPPILPSSSLLNEGLSIAQCSENEALKDLQLTQAICKYITTHLLQSSSFLLLA